MAGKLVSDFYCVLFVFRCFALFCFVFGPFFYKIFWALHYLEFWKTQEHGKYLDIQVHYCISPLCFLYWSSHQFRTWEGIGSCPQNHRHWKLANRESKRLASKNKKGRLIATISPDWLRAKFIQHPAPVVRGHRRMNWRPLSPAGHLQDARSRCQLPVLTRILRGTLHFPRSTFPSISEQFYGLHMSCSHLQMSWLTIDFKALIFPVPVTDLCRPSLTLPPPYAKNVTPQILPKKRSWH